MVGFGRRGARAGHASTARSVTGSEPGAVGPEPRGPASGAGSGAIGRQLDASARTVVLRGSADPGGDGRAGEQATTILDPVVAAAVADPAAATQAIPRGGPPVQTASTQSTGAGDARDAARGPERPLVSRRLAAELGLYTGAALVLVAVLGAGARGWSGWDPTTRWASVALASVALLAAGVFLRLPWSRRPGQERRRAVSAMLTLGAGLAVAAAGVALGVHQGSPTGTTVVHAAIAVAGMLSVALVARTPMSETGVLAALTWAVWVLVPAGLSVWAALVGLGICWATLGARLARGHRTAIGAGWSLALMASVGLAQGPWAWPVRAALAGATLFGLVAFLRGGPNGWLALGAGAATALAGSVVGGVISPALALLIGGLATMAVSGIALRGARRP